MEISNYQAIDVFIKRHPQAKSPLGRFIDIVKNSNFKNLNHLRMTFPHADMDGKKVIFNVGGNKYRLEAFIDYRPGHENFRILEVMTHDGYSKKLKK